MSTTSFPLVVLEESLMDGGGPGHPWLRAAALERSCGPGLSHPDVPWGAAARPLIPQGSGLSGVVGVVCCGPSDCDGGRALCSLSSHRVSSSLRLLSLCSRSCVTRGTRLWTREGDCRVSGPGLTSPARSQAAPRALHAPRPARQPPAAWGLTGRLLAFHRRRKRLRSASPSLSPSRVTQPQLLPTQA